MASIFFDGTDDYASHSNSYGNLPTAVPVTLSAWVRMTSGWGTGTHTILKIGDWSYKDFFRIQAFKNSSGVTRFEAGSHHGSERKAQHGSSITDDQWYHVCGVFTSATSRQVYVNGVAGTENTQTSEPDGSKFERVSIGASKDTGSATITAFLKGRISEVAVWGSALTTAEINQLKDGYSAILVNRENLRGYWPIGGIFHGVNQTTNSTNEVDLIGNLDLTMHNQAVVNQTISPSITYPSLSLVKRFTASPATSSALLHVIQSYFNVNR